MFSRPTTAPLPNKGLGALINLFEDYEQLVAQNFKGDCAATHLFDRLIRHLWQQG